ncbi:MAG: pyridoxamine 5'-phosphate oxidase family protein [Halanaeroarchaeum sp.]
MTENEYTDTEGMTDREIEERLYEAETGVLALARSGEAYAVPVACHYDGEALFLRLGEHEGSEKMATVETTDRASLVCYEHTPPDESWSVVVRGPIVRVDDPVEPPSPDADAFLPIRLFGEPVEAVEEVLFELEIESVTGRQT